MPRLTTRLPRYSRHKASGQAVVAVDGQDIYLGKFGAAESRQAYDRAIAEWATRRKSGVGPIPRESRVDLTVHELLAGYLTFAEGYYVKNGQMTREVANLKDAMKPLAEIYGDTAVAAFGPSKLKVVREAMIARRWCRCCRKCCGP